MPLPRSDRTHDPYSKEENGIVERANEDISPHIRSPVRHGHVNNWSRLLCTTDRVLNNSVKQKLGASTNILQFGDVFSVDRALLTQIDQDVSDVTPRSTQDFVDTLIARHAQIIDTAIHSQTIINEANLRQRYSNYTNHVGPDDKIIYFSLNTP